MIDPNKLKKGVRGMLKNGCGFILMDSKRGNIRMAQVDGLFGTDTESIYMHDVDWVEIGGDAVKVEATRQEYLETETDVYEFGQTVSNEDWGRGVGTSRVKKEDLE